MFDIEKSGNEYDYFMDNFGSPPPIGVGRFDRRLLIPRSQVPEWIERDSSEQVPFEEIDSLEARGIFAWLRGAGDDGRDLGVPMYVPYRIGLCRRLIREGWTVEEIKELVDWEESVITDMVEGDLPYEDDDRLIVLSEHQERLEMLEDERVSRLPVEQRPADWSQTGWTSDIKSMSDEELAEDIAEMAKAVQWLAHVDLDSASPKTRRRIGRRAFQLRMHYEDVRFLAVVSDRVCYEAGFSPFVHLEGPHGLIGDSTNLESFGRVNWYDTIRSWRVMNDPDHAPVRLPGFVCVGGHIEMPNALPPVVYAERYSLFRLDEYAQTFAELVGDRRCQHCDKPLAKTASDRRLYCDSKCSQAFRQKRHRTREKAAILERRGASRA